MRISPSAALDGLPPSLRIELLDEFNKIVRNYREGRWEPAELNGGKFCEVAYTILRGYVDGQYPSTASKPRNFPDACRKLENADALAVPHGFRILIPRVLLGLYDIRNNRGVGHVGGDVNPNKMDATLVVHTASWVVAELVRTYHGLTTEDAQLVVDGLVDRMVPLLWEVPNGAVRVLNSTLSMRERMLVVLYGRYPGSTSETDLVRAVQHSNGSVFRRDVLRPAHKKALVHYDEDQRVIYLSPLGVATVEEHIILLP